MRRLSVPEWCCAIRFNNEEKCLIDDADTEFNVIENTLRYWCADPFVFSKDGKYYLFFEMFDRLKRKGLIGCREITDNRIGDIQVVFECEHHLSYPLVYEEDGNIYMLPECEISGELFRLKCMHFPDVWVKDKVYIKERLADTTRFEQNDINYYLSEKVNDEKIFDRLDLFYEKNGEFKECKNNPVKIDINSARCAGNLFEYNGRIIRPSQNCGEEYGKKLNFNNVVSISEENYSEELVKCVDVKDVHLNSDNIYSGIHTYNKLDKIEVIDLKIPSNFNLLNIIGAVFKRLKIRT